MNTLGLWNDSSVGLAIETSSALGSVAIGRGRQVLGASRFTRPRAHAVEFVPAIQSLCTNHDIAPADISWVFVSAGPGSFTGLRIGITAARTMALAVSARIAAIPTLEVIAQNALEAAPPPAQAAVVLDAKRGRVYSATFALQGNHYAAIDEPREVDPASYLGKRDRKCAVLGEGVLYHADVVSASGLAVLPENLFPPRVETVYSLGVQRALAGYEVAARDLIPVYIRPPEAEEVWAARHPPSAGDPKGQQG